MTRTPATLTMQMVLQRRETYLVSQYLGLHFTIASLALGTAGVTAALLLADDALPGSFPVLFGFLWAASVLATITAFGAATVGSVLLPSRLPAIVDLVLPMLIAIIEFLLFAILAPQSGSDAAPHRAVTAWFLLMGGFCGLASCAIVRVRVLFAKAHCDDDIAAHVAWYRTHLRRDASGAAIASIVGITAGLTHLDNTAMPLWISCAMAVVLACFLIGASAGHARVASYWRAVLDTHLHAEANAATSPTTED